MKRITLTRAERAIENALLKGEYVSVSKAEFNEVAQAVTRRREKVVTRTARSCAICGKSLTISIGPDRIYRGGYYFGTVPVKKKTVEYWECRSCYRGWVKK